jgi:hypothetical protein
LFDKGTKSTTKGRKNLRSEVKSVTAEKLVCHGGGEKYNWDDVCKIIYSKDPQSNSRPCTLKNGDRLQLNPT